MATPDRISRKILQRIQGDQDLSVTLEALRPMPPSERALPPRLPYSNEVDPAAVEKRLEVLAGLGIPPPLPLQDQEQQMREQLPGHIESFCGHVSVPLGVAGPLRINGLEARGDFYVPIATSEGALVASITRGAWLISRSGGCAASCLTEAVGRAPCFVFSGVSEAAAFTAWLSVSNEILAAETERHSRYGRLLDIRISMLGREIYVLFEFTTGDAAGQNMVTLITDALCRFIMDHAPVKPLRWYVESNFSGDKKATVQAFQFARGRKTIAAVDLDARHLQRIARVTPEDMKRYWEISVLGGCQSGSIGVQGHYANTIAGLFLACGQDVACVAEASIGITRMDVNPDGNLHVSVTLPGLIVGTVGGGTGLPGMRRNLEMMDCAGPGKARKLAEIIAATTLAGEISIIAALTAGEFAAAHARYGRPPGSA